MNEPRWLSHAWKHLGQKERPGARHNPTIKAFFKDAGHPEISRDETAWCAAFVGACLERSGIQSTQSLMARSYLNWGTDAQTLNNPIGAIAVLRRGSNPALGHVGFLVGHSPQKVWLLGGNQSDAVTVTSYARSRLIGLRWVDTLAPKSKASSATTGVFDIALKHVLKMEGGYTNDPVDPGGPTNKGITLGDFASWRKTKVSPTSRAQLVADLKKISQKTVRNIYMARYWVRASCSDFPDGIALMHFDAAVNHGVGTANRMLQQALGTDVDGEVGPNTRTAAHRQSQSKTLASYASIRRARYRSLRHFWRFGRGWLRRVDETLKQASALEKQGGSQTSKQIFDNQKYRSKNMPGSRNQTTINEPKWWGQSVTIWGALVTAAAIVVPVLGPLTGMEISADVVRQVGSETFTAVQAVVGLAGTAMAIFGRFRAKQSLVQRDVIFKL